jgi:hypothetical protein
MEPESKLLRTQLFITDEAQIEHPNLTSKSNLEEFGVFGKQT